MTRFDVDRACGQTPCLCGDIETWHLECFAGKTATEVKAGYSRAYQIARAKLKTRAALHIARTLYSDRLAQAAQVIAASVIAKAAKTKWN